VTDAPLWLPVTVLFGLLLLAYLGMWRGWRRRGRKHELPPLAAVPDERSPATLRSAAHYFGTTVSGDWLDRVVARGLGARSRCELALTSDGLDVLRPSGAFRIPVAALRGARHDQGIAGKVVPPHGVLVVTWQHGEHLLDTGFRLLPTELSDGDVARATSAHDNSEEGRSRREWHDTWVQALTSMSTASVEGENA
jgi:hypothetical protein